MTAETIRSYTIGIIIVIFLAITAIVGGLTNYKQETLHCSKSENLCFVEKTNLLNIKSSKKLVKYSDIDDISYIKQKVRGNRVAKGYTEYLLIFKTNQNDRKIIFSEVFYEKEELFKYIKDLQAQMLSSSDIIILNRN